MAGPLALHSPPKEPTSRVSPFSQRDPPSKTLTLSGLLLASSRALSRGRKIRANMKRLMPRILTLNQWNNLCHPSDSLNSS
ncbi:hypothetical protein EDC04DRAFT_3141949, partial [Pisolithus marmoratus]